MKYRIYEDIKVKLNADQNIVQNLQRKLLRNFARVYHMDPERVFPVFVFTMEFKDKEIQGNSKRNGRLTSIVFPCLSVTMVNKEQ